MNNHIKYLVMDVDGTLTDGKIYMGDNGEIMKAFSIKDGYGIHDVAPQHGLVPVIITGRESGILTRRCCELGIGTVFQGIKNKTEQLKEITKNFSCVAYIGDDLNDLPCMLAVKEAGGVVGCPADAVKSVQELADYVTPSCGGCGAVRDFIDWLCKR